MNDIYKLNKPSGQPMATRNVDSIAFQATIKDDWLDRLITSMYIVLTGTLFSISLETDVKTLEIFKSNSCLFLSRLLFIK